MGGARKKKIVQVAAAVDVDDPDADADRKSDGGSASDASGYASDYKTEDVSAVVDDDETAGGFENLLDGHQLLERGHAIERIVRIEFGGSVVQPTSTPLRFFVKFRGLSYIHATWVFKSRLEADPSSKALLTRFMKKFSPDDEDSWDDRCLQIERIIDHDKDVGQVLVKWQTLPYAESTWEAISFLKQHTNTTDVQALVDDYDARNTVPSLEKLTRVDRPANADGFRKLEQSPIFNEGLEQGLELRPYQLDGLNWLIFNWMSHRNVILSDEMGLGKTAQTVSMVHHLHTQYNDRGPFLIVGPLSAVPHFAREFERFTNMQVVLYKDDNVSRQLQRLKEFHFHDENGEPVYKDKLGRPIFKFNVLITTYEILRSDLSELRQINWRFVCIDEAHRLKNNDSKTTSSMRELKTEFTLLLTGTPLQNNLEELWTLLNICDRVRFPSKDEFMHQFGGDSKNGDGAGMDPAAVTDLHEVIRPYILRRLKEDVEKSLKPKEETIVNVELTSLQRNVYRQIYENNGTLLVKGPKGAQAVSLRNVVIQLRKVCNHPWLIDGVEEQMLGIASMLPQLMDRDPTCPKNELVNRALSTLEPGKYREKLIVSSGKMVLLDKLLPRLLQRGSKVIIFSQMVAMLDLIADYLNISGYSYQRLDGRHRGVVRQVAIDKFNSDAECFVFLASTRAGGVGINLTAADTVIIYDSDWNPQNDVQAQARCHRIGQTKDVKIYRLVTRNTYEAEMFDRASKKLGLDRAVLARIESAVVASSAENAKMMDRLLRHGAYALFQDADEADKFCEEDIDQILAKRARVLTEEAGERSSEFSKAHFQVNETEEQKDIEFMIESEDPELWNKLGIRDNSHEKSIIWTKRDRKQTKLFSAAVEESGFPSSSSDSEGDDEKSASTKYRRWRKEDRRAVRLGLVRFGWGRWDRIRECRLSHRCELEIEWYCRCYMQKCLQAMDSCSGLFTPEEKIEWSSWAHSKLSEKFPSAPIRLELIWNFPKSKTDDADSEAWKGKDEKEEDQQSAVRSDPAFIADPDEDSAPAVRSKTPIDDSQDVVHPSKRLTAAQRILPRRNDPSWSTEYAHQLMKRVGMPIDTIDDGLDSEDNQRTARIIRREFPTYLLHDRLAVAVQPVLQSSDLNRDKITEICPLPSTVNGPSWWTPAHDREILWGCFLHGYNRWHEIREDPALAFPSDAPNDWKVDEEDDDGDGEKKSEKKLKRESGIGMDSSLLSADASVAVEHQDGAGSKNDAVDADKNRWPSIQVLQNRVKRLLDNKVIEAVKQRERERNSQIDAKLAKINAREEEKQRRHQEKLLRLSQWNLKEGWGLLRVLQESGLHLKFDKSTRPLSIPNITGHCGIPTADPDSYSIDWARLLREIGVDKAKSESNADDYYVDMINRCRRAVFLYGASASSGVTNRPDNSGTHGSKGASCGGGEPAEFEDPDECNDADVALSAQSGIPSEDPSCAPVSDKKRARKSKGTMIDGPNPLELPKQSFRVLQRVQAISTVRRMIFRPSLSHEQRMLVIKSAPSCGVVGWTADHDFALLLGINRHAFEWENIRMDPTLPFVPLDQENIVPLPAGKVALLKDYKAAQRIEQLCDLFVTEPWVQAKPIPSIKRPSHMSRRSGGKRNRKKICPSFPIAQDGMMDGSGDGDQRHLNEDVTANSNGIDDVNASGMAEKRFAAEGDDDDDDDDDDDEGHEDDDEAEDDDEDDDGQGDDDEDEDEDEDEDGEEEEEGDDKFSDPDDEN